jgi:transcription initiation factor TFIID subunit 9B
VRLPAPKYCLTAIDFDLLPTKPPPQDLLHLSSDEGDDGEDEEDEAEVDEAMDEDPSSPRRDLDGDTTMLTPGVDGMPGSSSMDLLGLTVGATQTATTEADGSDSDDGPDGLFEDDDEDEQEDDAQELAVPSLTGVSAPQVGEKRKLNEDDEYD